MAEYTVKITYNIPAHILNVLAKANSFDECYQVCRNYCFNNSYIDSDVYVNGLADAKTPTVEGFEGYGKSVYATNVYGLGVLGGNLPMTDNTSIASVLDYVIAETMKAYIADEDKSSFESKAYTFKVDTNYRDAIYWSNICRDMPEFTITVDNKASVVTEAE